MAAHRVAIITAGGSGMGADAARRLAADGFQVAILSSSGKGEALARFVGMKPSPLENNGSMKPAAFGV